MTRWASGSRLERSSTARRPSGLEAGAAAGVDPFPQRADAGARPESLDRLIYQQLLPEMSPHHRTECRLRLPRTRRDSEFSAIRVLRDHAPVHADPAFDVARGPRTRRVARPYCEVLVGSGGVNRERLYERAVAFRGHCGCRQTRLNVDTGGPDGHLLAGNRLAFRRLRLRRRRAGGHGNGDSNGPDGKPAHPRNGTPETAPGRYIKGAALLRHPAQAGSRQGSPCSGLNTSWLVSSARARKPSSRTTAASAYPVMPHKRLPSAPSKDGPARRVRGSGPRT